ncbi:MAG: MBL fold metallo-hydrolase [Candidatus Omnitrophica bacterium]|nr:MBL fold metallo-hydrolase [Candidatus Omnitrophota bacterium]
MFRMICTLVISLSLAIPAFTQEVTRTLDKISGHVYAYVGAKNASPSANSFGANSGVVIGEDAVMVIDTLISAKEAEKLSADIKKVTAKPVKYVVNTHSHLDHSWGNSVFVKDGAVVIGQENPANTAAKGEYALAHAGEFGLKPEDMEGTVLKFPTVMFKERLRVDLGGGVVVELAYPGPTHSPDSIMVYVTVDKVLFTGDILFTKYHPFLGDGDITNWIKVLSGLEKTTAEFIIPGHGPVSTVSDIRDMEVYLKEFEAQARELCLWKKQEDAPVLAEELINQLPNQGRTELPSIVISNLRAKYLPPATPVSGSEK